MNFMEIIRRFNNTKKEQNNTNVKRQSDGQSSWSRSSVQQVENEMALILPNTSNVLSTESRAQLQHNPPLNGSCTM